MEDHQLLALLGQRKGASAMLNAIQPVISTSAPKGKHTQDPMLLKAQRDLVLTSLQTVGELVGIVV